MPSLIQLLIIAVVLIGAIAIASIVMQKMGWAIPDFVVKIFWIVVCVVIAVLAIRFIASLL